MSQENVEIVRRAFEIVQEGVRRGDPGAAFDKSVREGNSAPNLEWRAGERGGVGRPGREPPGFGANSTSSFSTRRPSAALAIGRA
jgi:hypothetical protein